MVVRDERAEDLLLPAADEDERRAAWRLAASRSVEDAVMVKEREGESVFTPRASLCVILSRD